MSALVLDDLRDTDLEAVFADQRDPLGRRMAAFGAPDADDRAAFDARWACVRADPSRVVRVLREDGAYVGYLVSFLHDGLRHLGYWITRAAWGRGLATRALRQFLAEFPERPLYARAAADNAASRRVLEKCGFQLVRYERGFAQARGEEIDEVVMVLPAPR
ncbi:MAG: GNAT family N-acetyltransferase [Planctomycetes bacterium]|nr:GNAT family N-acetyltransferase [Planctomycetota bacterium]